jgi:hypothetical protein
MKKPTSLLWVVGAALLISLNTYGQGGEPKPGKLKISVSPIEAYTFLDGQAIGPHNHSLKVGQGTHHLIVANYGYKFAEQDVSITPGKTTALKVKLDPAGDKVTGPKGRIQFELGKLSLGDAGDHAVLLNGKTPAYFVGHVDEFNNNRIEKQELVVPPGTYQVTVTRLKNEVWSGPVAVAANQRVIVNISNGKQRQTDWKRGTQTLAGPVSRFRAGMSNATIVIAPVSGTVSANPSRINCGQQTQLTWASAETVDANMSGFSPVPVQGDRTVSPKQTTEYVFTATGPGGVVNTKTSVEVNTDVAAQLQASPAEVHYRRVGDKVIQQDPISISWTTSNADAASLSAVGTVENSGTRSITPVPTQATEGAVDETINYTLSATNTCGGSTTKTASVHLTGSMESVPGVTLQSVFYPTAYPTETDPGDGLLNSQRQMLTTLAAGFTKYLEYDPDAKISLEAHADPRGGGDYNQALSLRRANLVKDFLVSQGIAAEKIDASATGAESPLTDDDIANLVAQNPNPAPDTLSKDMGVTRLAYQRRVDIVLDPAKQGSTRYFPNTAPDSEIIWQRPMPAPSLVKQNQ